MNFWVVFGIILIILVLVYIGILSRNAGVVKTFGGKRPLSFLQNESLYFFPHFLYGIAASVNTYAAFTLGKIKFRASEREKFIGDDGGQFFVDWFSENDKTENTVPIVVLIHGINGASSEPCITSLGKRLKDMGWKACCILFRGCGGTKLTTLRSYNGGYTEDLHIFLEHLAKKYPNAPVGIIGYSLGGNMLIKYLGEQNSVNQPILKYQHVLKKSPIPKNVKAAVAVCPPHDYWGADALLPKKYNKVVGKGMLFYAQKHEYMLSQIPTYANLKDRKGVIYPREVDQNMNMHVFHYSTVKEFYDDCSDEKYIDGVGPHEYRGGKGSNSKSSGSGSGSDENIPLLILATKNDPLSLEVVIPYEKIEKNPNTSLLLYPGGGHLGFFSYFSDRRREHDVAIRFFHYEIFEHGKGK